MVSYRVLRTKSVHSPITRSEDGIRILATRYRGRGLEKKRYDVWMANLGPGEKLLKAFQAGKITWAGFSREYRKQLFIADESDLGNTTIKNHGQKFTLRLIKELARKGRVTLLCHCGEEEQHCHRHLLKAVIESGRV